jgi:hypothetical protein
MNRRPLNTVSAEDIATYDRDGAVCLRGMFDRGWCDHLLAAWNRVSADPYKFGLRFVSDEFDRPATPEIFSIKHLCRAIPEFEAYLWESPAAEIVGRTLGSREVGFFYDQIFAKSPGSTKPTPWHHDAGGWPVDGEMLPSFWMPLTPVKRDSCLEVVAGTHRVGKRYWNYTAHSMTLTIPEGRELNPDYEPRRGDPSLRFLGWDMEPGDALLVHPYAAHFNRGNADLTRQRVALSTRWYGDDVTWHYRPEVVVAPPGIDWQALPEGQRPSGDEFPIVWRDGSRLAALAPHHEEGKVSLP